ESNRRQVEKLSDGQLAYVHLPNTGQPGYQRFNRYYCAQQDKKGAIVDERYNGGGSAADYIIDGLQRDFDGYFNNVAGDRVPFTSPGAGIWGPKVMIINEMAGSGGDLMPYMFRRRKIGPLVGKRTWGGLVHTADTPAFVDGGSMIAPRGGFFDREGKWAVENEGVAPDIDVENWPKDVIAGAALVPARLVRGRTRPVSSRAAAVAVLGGVFFALDIALWNTSVMHTGAAVASILGNNTPVFVGILTWLVLRRRPRASFWIGLSLSLAGCLTIMLGPAHAGSAPITLYSNLLAIGGSAFFAAYLITTERIRQAMDTLTFNTLAIGGSIATLLALCLLLRLPFAGYPPRAWFAMAGLGLVSQLAAYYALVYALGHSPATLTSVGLL